MKQLKKIFIGVLAQFCVCVCLSLTVEAFDGDEYVSTPLEELNFIEESGTWMNPLYEDLKIEIETENARTASYSVESTVSVDAGDYMSFEEALEYFKDGIKNRSENIAPFRFYVDESLIPEGDFLYLIHSSIEKHTGVSTEGDTLIWEPLSASYNYEFAYDGSYFWVNFYLYEPYYLSTAEQESETIHAIQEEMKKMNLDGMSDYDKIYTIYDYICSHVIYDSENASSSSGTDEGKRQAHSAYGAIINKKAVCQGYALLMYRMLLEAGIDNRVVIGINHAWNQVKLGDQYYYCDATWDAYNPEETEADFHYFLCGTHEYRRNGSHHVIHREDYINQYPTPVYGYFSEENSKSYLPDEVISSGICGDKVSWELTGDGTLTVSGNGPMYDYEELMSPWDDIRGRIQHVVISEGVTKIGNYTFFDCYTMEDISIPDSVTYIGNYAFSACDSLESLHIPDSVTETGVNVCEESVGLRQIYFSKTLKKINDSFCSRCYALSDIQMSDGIEIIGNSAFYACNGLQTVNIPKSVDIIGEAAFLNAFAKYGDVVLTLPEGVREIQTEAFAYSYLTELNFPSSLTFIGQDACGNVDRMKSITIPDSVQEISDGAFGGCLRLQNIHLPDNEITYGSGIFCRCETLEEIYLPSSMEVIPDDMFRYNSALKYVHMPDIVHTIGSSAFANSGIEDIILPESLTTIKEYAFERTHLSIVLLPAEITYLGEGAFTCNTGLESVIFTGDVPEDIGTRCFYQTGSKCYYPETNTTWSKEIIDSYENRYSWYSYSVDEDGHMWPSFYYCDSPTCTEDGGLTWSCILCKETRIIEVYPAKGHSEVADEAVEATCTEDGLSEGIHCSECGEILVEQKVIPAKGHNFKDGLCADCGKMLEAYGSCGEDLTWILDDEGLLTISGNGKMKNYSSAKNVPWNAYAGQIKTVSIEKGVTSIGDFAFYGLTEITDITLPKGMEIIGNYAFKGCTSLESVELPKTLWKIGESGFFGCAVLKEMNMPDSVTVMGAYAFKGCEGMESLHISAGLVGLNESAFYGCSSLTEVIVPEGIKRIDSYVFKNCSGLISVNLPSTLTKLGESAFYGCSSLNNIDIPDDITSIGSYTFKNCTALEKVNLPETLTSIGEAAFYGCTNLEEIVMPETVSYVKAYAFKNCANLKTIVLSSSIERINEAIFYGCTNLEEIVIPDTVTKIDSYAFKNCISLREVQLSSGLTQINESTFYGCTSLESLVLPENVTSIGSYAFRKCSSLKNVEFSADLRTIGESAFYGCEALTAILLPEGVTEIGAYAFKTCTGMDELSLPDSLEVIGESAFYGCTGMTEISIPCNVRTVGGYAFARCVSLAFIEFMGDAPTIGENAFSKVISEVYYPAGNDTWTLDVMQNYGGTLTWMTDEKSAVVYEETFGSEEVQIIETKTESEEEPETEYEIESETEIYESETMESDFEELSVLQ